jgi:CHAT domain-containing protein
MRLLTSQRSEEAILEPAQQLYDWLIRPFADELAQSAIETLVFVPDGYLRRIPLAVLHDGQHYLVEDYSVAITPGLRLLASQRLEQVQINPFVAGLSDARPGFQAIPAVQEEVATISADFLGSKTLLNESFTQETLLEILQNESFPIVHLATHGVFGETPEETFLLAWDNRIKATDLAIALKSRELQTQIPIELLVLSACQTALGDNRAGLGLAGLAVRSGARSTIASLWSVSDASTSQLMRNLYGRLRQFHAENQNVNRAQVLRQAQLSLLHTEDYQHPYFWGAFILIGNWQ